MLALGLVAQSGCLVLYESPYEQEPECSEVCESPRLEFTARPTTEPGFKGGRDFPGEGEVVAELRWGRRGRKSQKICLRGPCVERRPEGSPFLCFRDPCRGDREDYGSSTIRGVDQGERVDVSVFYEGELAFEDSFVADYTRQSVEVTWDPGDYDYGPYEKECRDCLVHEQVSMISMPSVVSAEGYPGQCDPSDSEVLYGSTEKAYASAKSVEWVAEQTGVATFIAEPFGEEATTTQLDVRDLATCRILGADEGQSVQLAVPVTQGQRLSLWVRAESNLRVETSA